jgi:hypothetical protein
MLLFLGAVLLGWLLASLTFVFGVGIGKMLAERTRAQELARLERMVE